MSEMIVQVNKYGIEYQRKANYQGLIKLQGTPFRIGGGDNVYVTVRFHEYFDERREDHGEIERRDGSTYDSIPGTGPMTIKPRIAQINDSEVYVDLPMRDFSHMRHMLQTESPVFIKWHMESSGNPDYRDYFGLATFSETPGEGFSDSSS
ncbi:hypothetical protein [Microbulbifer hainanensis]|uniref:hypothetical protein n=1 Tax=Microbulbifer hainanensis TaxID=2735675 RepID=UPI001866379B|nr:hypothetical protein [Microbulbifer hainanensis]